MFLRASASLTLVQASLSGVILFHQESLGKGRKDSWKMEDNYLQDALDEVFSFSNFFFVSEGYLL